MNFTYQSYRGLLHLLRDTGYCFREYKNYKDCPRCVVMRHDIDTSVEQAWRMAKLEAEEGIASTYFVLLKTDFYNPASEKNVRMLHEIQGMGHYIGLHFDEAAYTDAPSGIVERISREAHMLSEMLELPITTVSMHRPSQEFLQMNLQIPGMVNSYCEEFVSGFKYLSDSRRHWREPVCEIVGSGLYDRLHILTHPFWYHEEEQTISQTLAAFVHAAGHERYCSLNGNMKDIPSVLQETQ